MGAIRKAFKIKNTIRHPARSATHSVRRSVYKAVVPKSARKVSYQVPSVRNAAHNPISASLPLLRRVVNYSGNIAGSDKEPAILLYAKDGWRDEMLPAGDICRCTSNPRVIGRMSLDMISSCR